MVRELQYPLTTDSCLDQITFWIFSAENEVAAYRGAVLNLYGAEASDWATNDWLDALETMDWAPCNSGSSWRKLTISSASRLAAWLEAGPGS